MARNCSKKSRHSFPSDIHKLKIGDDDCKVKINLKPSNASDFVNHEKSCSST